MGKILKYITALLPVLIVWSCNTTGCLQNQSSVPLAGFYNSADDKTIGIDSLSVYGVGAPNDSSLITTKVASRVYLPFRSESSSTSFCFRYLAKALDYPRLNDTITFTYTSEPKFVSEECGAMYFYTITGVTYTTHLIESVEVTDSLINNTDIEKIRIYFRVAEDDDEEDSGENL